MGSLDARDLVKRINNHAKTQLTAIKKKWLCTLIVAAQQAAENAKSGHKSSKSKASNSDGNTNTFDSRILTESVDDAIRSINKYGIINHWNEEAHSSNDSSNSSDFNSTYTFDIDQGYFDESAPR
ncbi:MAG: hypothetical protein LBI61_04350 [Puniceicoccales bacterium]|jgi:hypothetical protein|nr:hypothetical protein [Puniceicoccales bacterium]